MCKTRIGIIGIGSFGSRRAKVFNENPRAQVVCVCSRSKENAKSKAEALGCDFVTDYRQLLERPDVDGVTISIPNTLHYQVGLDALKAGKHTTIEYPITQTVEQFDTLCAEAKNRNLVIHHALTPVIEPQPVTMKKLIDKIGRVMTIRSSYTGGSGGRDWYLKPGLRGNFYSALTIHMIVYQKVVLEENPNWVFAACNFHDEDNNNFHSGSFLCQYPSGVLAYNDWGMGYKQRRWEWTIEGEKGRLVYEPRFKTPHCIRIITNDEDTVVEMESQQSGISKDTDNFIAQIINGADSYVSENCNRDVIAICEAAQQSAHTKQKVSPSRMI